MGKNLSVVKEDVDFRRSLEDGDPKSFATYLSNRLSEANRPAGLPVGFKYPNAYKSIDLLSETKDLCIIVVSRDPVSVAIRNTESMFHPFSQSLSNAIKDFRELERNIREVTIASSSRNSSQSTSFSSNFLSVRWRRFFGGRNTIAQENSITQRNSRIIFVSYEKIMTTTENTFRAMYESSGMSSKTACELAQKSTHAISHDSSAYRSSSNLRPEYKIDQSISNRVISGWCRLKTSPTKKVPLTLKLKDQVLATTICDLPRADLDGQCCGFKFDLSMRDIANTDLSQIKVLIGESSFTLE